MSRTFLRLKKLVVPALPTGSKSGLGSKCRGSCRVISEAKLPAFCYQRDYYPDPVTGSSRKSAMIFVYVAVSVGVVNPVNRCVGQHYYCSFQAHMLLHWCMRFSRSLLAKPHRSQSTQLQLPPERLVDIPRITWTRRLHTARRVGAFGGGGSLN